MLDKKLLTLACAIGILACGACFLPPLPEHRPPPPLLQGIRRIRVVVSSSADSPCIDPAALAREIAEGFNLEISGTGVKAYVRDKAEDKDAILYIEAPGVNGTPGSAPMASGLYMWSFEVVISATLTDPGGHVVWQEKDGSFRIFHAFPPKDLAELWSDQGYRNWLASAVGERLVKQMLHGQ